MAKSHRPYPPEYRERIIDLVRSGRSPEALAREFEPSAQCISELGATGGSRRWTAPGWPDDRRTHRVAASPPRECHAPRGAGDLEKSRGLVRTGDRIDPVEGFRFMKANQAAHSIPTMCRVLGVSAGGFYAWRGRGVSARRQQDRELLEQIRVCHQRSRGTYGAPRIHRDLRAAGVRVGRKRVARLLKEPGLRGVSRRKWPVTTVRAAHARPAPDLVQRAFTATGPNQLWVADITYIPTRAQTLYLAVVLDVWSRRIVGWAMATHLRTSLVVAALEMAVTQRRPEAVIHHADQGCQYTAIELGRRCREAHVRPSMGSVGDCYDCEDDWIAVRGGLTPVTSDSVSWR